MSMTKEQMATALEEGRIVIEIAGKWWLAQHTGFGVKDMGNGHWLVRVTGGPHPRKNGHGIISDEHPDIPYQVLDKPM